MVSDRLLDMLICPVCGSDEMWAHADEVADDVVTEGTITCRACKRWYPIADDIPSLMPPQLASSLRAADQTWAEWREVMGQFLRWRDAAWADPEAAEQRRRDARALHERFLDFCELTDGSFTCLDVGSGTAHLADLLEEECFYVGIDPLPAGHMPGGEPAPERMPRPEREVELVQGVGEVLPFADGSFDCVLIVGSLDHCRDPQRALEQAQRVLRPGGRFGVLQGVLSEGTEGGLGGVLKSLMGALTGSSGAKTRKTHMHSFTTEQLEAIIGSHFSISEVAEDSGRAFVRATTPGGDGAL